MTKPEVLIVGGARTPMIDYVGALKDISALELGAIASRGAFAKYGVKPEWIDHAVFGNVKSHGCVNLAPWDAKSLFGWTDPQLPAGWHAAFAAAGAFAGCWPQAEPGHIVSKVAPTANPPPASLPAAWRNDRRLRYPW